MGNGLKVLGFGALALAAMQLFPVARTNPPSAGPLRSWASKDIPRLYNFHTC